MTRENVYLILAESLRVFSNVKVVVSDSLLLRKTDFFSCQVINGLEDTIPELDVQLEEADLRIMPHALNAAVDRMSTIILLSKDTDILVAR